MSTDRPTSTTDHEKEADRPPVDHEPMTIKNAARRLGISQNAVLQRAKRGTLYSEVIDGKRMVWVPPGGRSVGTKKTTDQPVATTKNEPTDQTETAALAGIIDRLVRENREAWSMAAVWQERANVLQERILALEAGPVSTPTPTPLDQTRLRMRTPAPLILEPEPTAGEIEVETAATRHDSHDDFWHDPFSRPPRNRDELFVLSQAIIAKIDSEEKAKRDKMLAEAATQPAAPPAAGRPWFGARLARRIRGD
jgi:hypothetical protein